MVTNIPNKNTISLVLVLTNDDSISTACQVKFRINSRARREYSLCWDIHHLSILVTYKGGHKETKFYEGNLALNEDAVKEEARDILKRIKTILEAIRDSPEDSQFYIRNRNGSLVQLEADNSNFVEPYIYALKMIL